MGRAFANATQVHSNNCSTVCRSMCCLILQFILIQSSVASLHSTWQSFPLICTHPFQSGLTFHAETLFPIFLHSSCPVWLSHLKTIFPSICTHHIHPLPIFPLICFQVLPHIHAETLLPIFLSIPIQSGLTFILRPFLPSICAVPVLTLLSC